VSNAGDMAELAGRVSFYVIFLGAAIGLGFYLAKKQPPKRFIWWPVIVAAILLIGSFLGQISSNVAAASPNASAIEVVR
jgi:hypothetical protein